MLVTGSKVNIDEHAPVTGVLDDLRSIVAQFNALLEQAEFRLMEIRSESAPARPRLVTERELEILGLVGKGLTNAKIANELQLSAHTVHRHLSNIMTKLDVSSRAAAVARDSKLGLL